MADQTETVTFKLPSGEMIDAVIPAGLSDAAAKTFMLSRRPDLFQGMKANPAFQDTPMETSAAPAIARGVANSLPVVGGAVGAIVGAPADIAGGAGSVIGAGLGSGAGTQLKQMILNKGLGEGPSNTSAQGLQDTGINAGIAAATEVPGWLLTGGGRFLLNRLANASSAKETGDVVAAFQNVAPKAISGKGLSYQLDRAADAIGDKVGEQLAQVPGQVNTDIILNPARMAAYQEDAAIAAEKGISAAGKTVRNAVNTTVALAKTDAGITGNVATPKQLEDFRKIISNKAFSAKTDYPTVSNAVQRILQGISTNTSNAIKVMALKSGNQELPQLYGQLTDIYAAQSALKAYPVGRAGSLAIAAATHPRTTAALSPLVTDAAVVGGKPAISKIRRIIGR